MILKFFKNSFIQGFFIIVPFLFLLWLLKVVINFGDNLLEPLSQQIFNFAQVEAFKDSFWFRIAKFLVICFSAGVLFQIISHLPFVKNINDFIAKKIPLYKNVKDVLFRYTNKESIPFNEVVYVKINPKGDLSLAFVSEKISSEKWAVFIPTCPNPTSGALRIVSTKDIFPSNMNMEKAVSVLLTCGTGIKNTYDKTFLSQNKIDSENKI